MGFLSRRVWLLFSLPLIVLAIGTVGFMIISRLSFIDSLYFTLVTISTVGYGDIFPTTIAGKIFSLFLIIFGIGVFLTIVTTATQMLVQSGEDKQRLERLHMLIGVFFTEVGNELLRLFTAYDPDVEEMRRDFASGEGWSEMDLSRLKARLAAHHHAISPELIDLEALRGFLKDNGELMLRQLESSDLKEHESFTELLWAVVHLRDEFLARRSLRNLPESDVAHLANDARRVYNLLTRQWLDYMQHLKGSYPYLFSLALRTNPFVIDPSAIVE